MSNEGMRYQAEHQNKPKVKKKRAQIKRVLPPVAAKRSLLDPKIYLFASSSYYKTIGFSVLSPRVDAMFTNGLDHAALKYVTSTKPTHTRTIVLKARHLYITFLMVTVSFIGDSLFLFWVVCGNCSSACELTQDALNHWVRLIFICFLTLLVRATGKLTIALSTTN